MKAFVGFVGAVLVISAACVAQDSSPATAQDSDQSVAAAAAASRGHMQDEQTKKADIYRLLEITGAANLATQSMDELEKTTRPLVANSLPPGDYREKLVDLFFEKFRSKRDPNQLIELIVPIYEKYYSDDEIKQLISLYQTPIGQKMLTVLPQIVMESQLAGRKWGEQLGRECMMEVLAEHPELQHALQEAKVNTQPK